MDFSNISVLCIGDLMLDRFLYGDVERISPEAPVPVLRLNRTREMLGGAGNVSSNIASLGGRAILVGLIGRDDAGGRLRRILAAGANVEAACIDTEDRPTICKTRLIAAQQQVVRADEESRDPLTERERAALLEGLHRHLGHVGAVVLADYGKGVLDAQMVSDVIAAARRAGLPTFVDPKARDFSRYRGATCITPNLNELAAASGLPVGNEAGVIVAARKVLEEAQAQAILATRSEKGMMLVEESGEVHSVDARAREVFDVSGAGDTVIATMALCHAAGRPLSQAMHVANAAASVVVSKAGTATADLQEVIAELDAHDHDRHTQPPPGVESVARVQKRVAEWKGQGLVVGFTNGCFDILHPGHVSLLEQARAACDRLVVALNTDESVRRLKGDARPINALPSRARVVAALRSVDCVTCFGEETPLELIRTLTPDVLVKGADYALDKVVGGDLVRAAGGRVVLADLTAGQSTSNTIDRIKIANAVA